MSIDYAAGRVPAPSQDRKSAEPAVNPALALYLDRLTRLVQKINVHGRYLTTTDRRMQLLNRAALATFRSCRALGIEHDARAILSGLRRELALPADNHCNPLAD